MAFCEKCREEINRSWKHCPACGQPVKKIIAKKLILKEASLPPAKKSQYNKEIAIVLVAIFILSLGLFTFSRSSSDSSNYVDQTEARLYEGPELPELIGVDKYAMVDIDAAWTKERFVLPVDHFITSKYCDIKSFLNNFSGVDFAHTYRIEGSPDFMIQSPGAYEFATPFEKAMHLVLAYAVRLSQLEENGYVYSDKKQKRLYSKQFESYKSDVLLAAESLCIPFTQVRNSIPVESVIKKFTDEKYRKTYLDFLEKVDSTYVYQYEDDGKVFCKEEETNLNGTKLITCYP
jgi:hypothetical protein